ncbi:MAG: ATP-binding cassette domain-containing protein [Acidobacteriota bacterium]
MHQEQESIMIEFRNVSYSPDGQRDVLSSLNLNVAEGETMVLLGRSGCGKTTTLKLINRLLDASGGQVLVEGRAVGNWDPIRLRRRIGYVIQEVGLFPHLSIERNIGLLPQLEGWTPERRNRRVDELLEMVALEPGNFRKRYPRELSGGQRQRVGVARALAADPPVLLMDEPFGALDPLTRDEIQREFLALQERLHKTIVFVTHDIREALIVGTRIALLEAGRLVGTYSRVDFLKSNDPVVSSYLSVLRAGDPAVEP